MTSRMRLVAVATVCLLMSAVTAAGLARAGALALGGARDKVELTYSKSYALVIGIDDYSNGLPRLKFGLSDAREIATALETQGFVVTRREELTGVELETALKSFFQSFAHDTEARGFVWFAGVGRTIKTNSRDIGYLLGRDAAAEARQFTPASGYVSLDAIDAMLRDTQAKHIMVVLDACVSASMIAEVPRGGNVVVSRSIADSLKDPVRIVMSSASAGQFAADNGVFRQAFIEAIGPGSPADANRDGLVTSSEILDYVSHILRRGQSPQTPQFGHFHSSGLQPGDFVFQVDARSIPRPGATAVLDPPRTPGDISRPTSMQLWADTAVVPETLQIEVISPKALDARGIPKASAADTELIGVIKGDFRSYDIVAVDNKRVSVDPDGLFRTTVRLNEGVNRINVAGFAKPARVAHYSTTNVELSFTDQVRDVTERRFALVIGIQKYVYTQKWRTLQTPLADAEEIANALRTHYGFALEITDKQNQKFPLLLKDATQDQIFDTLQVLKENLTDADDLLIYFAGHGQRLRDANDIAFWIPANGKPDTETSWISSATLSTSITRFNAKSILVIADSCFSGGMLRLGESPPPPITSDRSKMLLKAAKGKSRRYIASGGDEPVPDGGGSGHSLFARALLTVLRSDTHMPDAVLAEELVPKVKQLMGSAPQDMRTNLMLNSGHEDGDFVFFRKRGTP